MALPYDICVFEECKQQTHGKKTIISNDPPVLLGYTETPRVHMNSHAARVPLQQQVHGPANQVQGCLSRERTGRCGKGFLMAYPGIAMGHQGTSMDHHDIAMEMPWARAHYDGTCHNSLHTVVATRHNTDRPRSWDLPRHAPWHQHQ